MTCSNRTIAPAAPCARVACTWLVVLLALVGAELRAQDSTAVPGRQWMIGGSLGMFGVGQQPAPWQYAIVGMHFTQVKPGALGADISVGIIPYGLSAGALAMGSRVGVTLPIAVGPGLLLLPSAGLSLLGGVSVQGSGGTTGVNIGGASVFGSGSLGLRTGITWHRLRDADVNVWLLEVGLVGLPRRR